jgi:tetratricopeptide (TPR) repeat protein
MHGGPSDGTCTGAAAAAAPFSIGAASFGRGMFSEFDHLAAASSSASAAAAATAAGGLHFPTASNELLQAGFHRSAGLLVECALTFYSPGLASSSSSPFHAFRPSPSELHQLPPPEAMALFGECCLAGGEWKRAVQYLKTALAELAKKKRSPEFAGNAQVQQMNVLSSPEKEWTLSLVEALLHAQEEAHAQKLLEQMYTCLLANPHQFDAMPPKYLLILAKFYAMPPQQTSPSVTQPYLVHRPSAAIVIHTLLLKHYPLAVESALELIRLGTDPRPIVAQAMKEKYAGGGLSTVQAASLQQQSLFLHLFLTAHYHISLQRHEPALSLEEGGLNFLISLAPRSMHLLETKAHLQLQTTDQDLSLRTLERMHTIDPYSLDSMDVLALLYIRSQGRAKELQVLMAHCLRVDETRPESWLVAACAAVAKDGMTIGKDKAMRYLEKAALLCNNHNSSTGVLVASRYLSPVRASMVHTLRGTLHLEWERASSNDRRTSGLSLLPASPHLDAALKDFRKAVALNAQNQVAVLGLAQAYAHHAILSCSSNPASLSTHSHYKTAVALVSAECSRPENERNPRTHANAGLILGLVQEGRQKGAKALHLAMQLEAEYSEAVLALAEMYCASQQYTDAVNMLGQYTKKVQLFLASGGAASEATRMLGRRDTFLCKLASIHAARGDIVEAVRVYKEALAVNPGCTQAQEGILKVEQDAKGQLQWNFHD